MKTLLNQTGYDSRPEVLSHIRRVQTYIGDVVDSMVQRASMHDESKLREPEKSVYDEFIPLLKTTEYGTPQYMEMLKHMKPALDHHYEGNDHHPESKKEAREIWKPVPQYEGFYEVSNFGEIRSIEHVISRPRQGNWSAKEKLLAQNVTPKGYLRVQLNKDGRSKNILVHRLVAEVFIDGQSETRNQVNHLDGNKKNNFYENLEWVSPSENLQHAYDNGLRKPSVKYVVHCNELDITTFGIEKMTNALLEQGYDKAHSLSIWACINGESDSFLGLTFEGFPLDEYVRPTGVMGMSFLSMLEMLADWKAASAQTMNGDFERSLDINKKRFEIPDALFTVMKNTAVELGWL